MRVEIDQSGRVEKLDTGTAVAFSNGKNGVLFISAGEKRKVIQYLKKHPTFSHNFASLFFALLVFVVLRKQKLTSILVDEEYTGKESIIEEIIIDLLRREKLHGIGIRFARIGKHSRAHLLAWQVHRDKGRFLKVIKVSAKEIIGLLGAKK